nr:MAG TPA: hypothetical protein [Caudoviricetes sp.]
MFTNVMFYASWVIIAMFPLMIAALGPRDYKGKNHRLPVCVGYHFRNYDFDLPGR